jgi:tRNA pseudouridine13 synthase
VREVASALGIRRDEIGVAGLKDRDAVTLQWISLPAAAGSALAGFAHPEIQLGPPRPHGQKLRRGHLRGNRFEIVVRDLDVEPAEAVERVEAKLAVIEAEGGLDNYFGEQRFGREGANVERGLAALRSPRRGRGRGRGDLILSAGQSVLFNLYVVVRRERSLGRTVLLGDVLKKTQTGGMFVCDDPETDQSRLDAGEIVITGPIFGSKMKSPPEGSPSAELEASILERVGIPPEALKALGRKAPGTRRALTVKIEQARVRAVEAVKDEDGGSGLSAGLCLSFTLPAGAYATDLLRELTGAPR